MNIEEIKSLIQLMKEENMKVIAYESGDDEIYLEAFDHDRGEATPVKKKSSSPASSGSSSDLVDIKANQIGTFYSQPEEDSDESFVSVGDSVEAGDQIGLIETMKIFNELVVDQAGVIDEILVSNGEAVEFGQVIMRLRPEEA